MSSPVAAGDRVPDAVLHELTDDGMQAHKAAEFFGKGVHAVFGVPGAFTPTCSNSHCPGFKLAHAAFKARGVSVSVVAPNDAFVMQAWKKAQGAEFPFLADGDGSFGRALGLELDLSAHGLGKRTKRFGMIVKDGAVHYVGVDAGDLELSTADNLLKHLPE